MLKHNNDTDSDSEGDDDSDGEQEPSSATPEDARQNDIDSFLKRERAKKVEAEKRARERQVAAEERQCRCKYNHGVRGEKMRKIESRAYWEEPFLNKPINKDFPRKCCEPGCEKVFEVTKKDYIASTKTPVYLCDGCKKFARCDNCHQLRLQKEDREERGATRKSRRGQKRKDPSR